MVRTPPNRQPKPNVNAQKVAMAEKVIYMRMHIYEYIVLLSLILLVDDIMQREQEALAKVRDLEKKISEMTDEMNALITKERLSNDELQGVRKELMKVYIWYPNYCLC